MTQRVFVTGSGTHLPGAPIPFAMVGGLVEEGGGLGDHFRHLVEEVGGELCPHPVLPVRGAALLALAIS